MNPRARPPPLPTPAGGRRSVLIATIASLTGCVVASGPDTAGNACIDCLSGSFFQPLLAHQDRSDAQWRVWMAELVAVGVRRLVLQHVALEPYDVLVPGNANDWRASAGGAALARILDAAQAHRVRVWLGLSYDPRYWSEIETTDLQALSAYLTQRGRRVQILAQALKPATRHAAVAGWYISDEIDDLSWVQPERAALLVRWLADATRVLTEAAPEMPIAISGFVHTESTTPQALAEQWRRWLAGAPRLAEVLLQDGIGAAKTTLDTWPACLNAVCGVARERGRQCVPVVELFAGAGTSLAPAPAARVARQLQIAQSAGTGVVAFSVPEFVTTGQQPARHLQAYLLELCRRRASNC